MRKIVSYISASCLLFLLTSFTTLEEHKSSFVSPLDIDASASFSAKVSLLYGSMDLQNKGLSREAFEYAYKGYLALVKKKHIQKAGYLTICDLSQSSRRKRLYVIDIINNKVIQNTFVAHGRNSGGEFARKFSNRTESFQSSLGFYVTGKTYRGDHGLSLRLEGLEPGFNDKAYKRAIVIHGADYIGYGSTGRSFGCPAVPVKDSKDLINTIKNGTCLFIYHPQKTYLQKSKILNG